MAAPINPARGHELPHSKLTVHDVRLIRALHADGLSWKDIADKFDVHPNTIWKAIS